MAERPLLSTGDWGAVTVLRASAGSFALPVGTVTFLLGDVEGSTRAWEGGGAEVASAMARLDDLADDVVARHGGVRPVEQGEGDSFVSAFARASEAVAAALEIQLALRSEQLPLVRIGLHTGEAQLRDGTRYFGRTITRAARLRDLGHGGQILLSRACVDVAADHLPESAAVQDLGPHRMRDLARPEHVFQLIHPDLDSNFPALRSLDRHLHNLPVQLTSFVGREADTRKCVELLGEHRFVTLTGSGGCGKTRLGLEVAAEVLPGRADGAWFVDLSGLHDPSLVASAVMGVVGIREISGQSHAETLVAQLASREVLILLDNCEHVLESAADLAERLLQGCAGLTLLVTSREPLGVAGEVVWRVPCLSVPDEPTPIDIASLDTSEAVRLFIERARAARPNFSVTNENAPAVVAICQRLDGIPLAIELAAARVRMMSPVRIASALSDRFHLLTGGSRTALPRQQTLRASVDWSYELLSPPERALLPRLSVFAGGFGLDAAERVGAGGDVGPYDVLGHLSSLVDKSLVQVNDAGDRYRLLETIRAYAAAELAASGEEPATKDRHLDFLAEFADRAEAGLWTAAAPSWVAALSIEHDNLRAALDWAMTSGNYDTGARTLYGIVNFYYIRALRQEGLARCEAFLAEDISPARRAELLWPAASLSFYSDPAAQYRYGDALAELGRQIGDPVALARGLVQRSCAQAFFDPPGALATLEEGRALAQDHGDQITVVDSYCFESAAHMVGSNETEAFVAARRAFDSATAIGWPWGIGFATVMMGMSAYRIGELDTAQVSSDTLSHLADELDDPWFTQNAVYFSGVVAMYRGDPGAADALARARHIAETTGDHMNLTHIITNQAGQAITVGDDDRASAILQDGIPLADALVPAAGIVDRALLAEIAIRRGDLDRAREWQQAASALPGADNVGWLTRSRARLARARLDHHRAWELAREGLEASVQGGAQLLAVDFLELLAQLAADTEQYDDAARFLAASDAQRTRIGYRRFEVDQSDVDATIQRIENALSSEQRTRCEQEGQKLSLADATAYVNRGRGSRNRPSAGWASLTPTERKVVDLVVDGLTNAEIAERMFVSTATVKSHLTHVFVKVGATNRTDLRRAARDLAG